MGVGLWTVMGSDQGPSGARAVFSYVKSQYEHSCTRSGRTPLRTYQDLAGPKVITIDEDVAAMKLGVVDLPLVDLPEYTLFLTEFTFGESLALPSFPVPVLVGV